MRTARTVRSWSAPSPTTTAVPATVGAPSATSPPMEHSRSSTRFVARIRLALPDAASVVKPTRPSPSGAIHTGTGTASPDRRNVVSET